jgi:nucleotide-binding universal stress UspA family protein
MAGTTPPDAGPRRILYSTGFAPQSLFAGQYALAMAQQQRAELAMLHVVRDLQDNSQQSHAQIEADAKARLLSLIPADANLPAPPEAFVAFGNPADAILKLAAEWNPELIVLGLRRPEESSQRRTWATAYSVVSNSPCPVLTVRIPDGEPKI